MSNSEHILLLGATGVSGLIFIKHVFSLPQATQPKLTLYVRSQKKLPADVQSHKSIHIVEGALDSLPKLSEAMSGGITTVVSFLGAYVSFTSFALQRKGPTPIGDSMPTVCAAMRANNVKRILVLSTLSGFLQPGEESANLPWGWYIKGIIIAPIIVPQGNAEMRAIAQAVASQTDLDWTVFRVPHLNEGPGSLEVVAGLVNQEYRGSTELSRASLVQWVLTEIKERKWVKGAPMLGNP